MRPDKNGHNHGHFEFNISSIPRRLYHSVSTSPSGGDCDLYPALAAYSNWKVMKPCKLFFYTAFRKSHISFRSCITFCCDVDAHINFYFPCTNKGRLKLMLRHGTRGHPLRHYLSFWGNLELLPALRCHR